MPAPSGSTLITSLPGGPDIYLLVSDFSYILYGVDGSGDATELTEVSPDPSQSSSLAFINVVNGRAIFLEQSGSTYTLIGTDGTADGTQVLLNFDADPSLRSGLLLSGTTGAADSFFAYSGGAYTFYNTDGTAAGTQPTSSFAGQTWQSGNIHFQYEGSNAVYWTGNSTDWIGATETLQVYVEPANIILDQIPLYLNWTSLLTPPLPTSDVFLTAAETLHTNFNVLINGLGVDQYTTLDVGGTLNVQGSDFENSTSIIDYGLINVTGTLISTGIIDIRAGASLILQAGGEIYGATLLSINGGTLAATADIAPAATLENVTIAAGSTFVLPGDSAIYFLGGMTNNGTIALEGGGGSGVVEGPQSGTVTLDGGGIVVLSTSTDGSSGVLAASLVNVDNTIEGAGEIVDLTNATGGTVDANTPDQTLTFIGGLNGGLLMADNGGILSLPGGVTNTGGLISADGGKVVLAGRVTGGALRTSSGGFLTANPSSGEFSVSGVTIVSGSTATIEGNTAVEIDGMIINSGTLALTGIGSSVSLYSYSGTLAGGGLVELGSGGGDYNYDKIYGSLTNADNVIEGTGHVGLSVNSAAGTIDANLTGRILDVDDISANSGLLTATNSGTLAIDGEVDDAGGAFVADGGVIELVNGVLVGGILTTANGGTVATLNTSRLNGVTIAAGSTFLGMDNSTTYVMNTVFNLGTIFASGSGTVVGVDGTLAGGGVVALAISGDGPGSLQGGGGYSLSNFDNTIEGAGGISGITNEAAGTIDANVTGQALTIGNLTNLGLLEATGRGVLSLSGSVINTGGTINATSGEIDVLGQITGGVLSSNGGGLLASAAAAYGNATLNGVTVAAGSTFIVRGNTDTVINGTLYNAGTTSLTGSGANLSTLSGYGPSYSSLAGGGVVTLSPSGSNARNVVFNLTNVDNTIEGSGRILQITNATAAVVDANLNGQVLDVEDTVTNSGLLTATNGGTLTIGGEVDDAGGAIVADGGVIELVNGVLVGGTLTTANGGTVATLNTSRLNGVTIAAGATFVGATGSTTYVMNTVVNLGTIFAADAGTVTGLGAGGTLAGGGVVALAISGDGPGSLQGGGGYSLSNFDNTIEGAGGISGITNEAAGTIDANVTGQALTIGNLTNTGLLEATSGGVLSLSASVINTNGTIDAASGGEVDVLGQITGGVLSSNGGGLLASAAAAYGNATLNGVTVAAGSTFIVRGSTDTVISGTLVNDGMISLTGSGANPSKLSGNGPSYSSLTGGGVVTLSPSGSNYSNTVYNLTNVDNTIEGSGAASQITNAAAGTIDANLAGQTLDVDGVTNSGLLAATNGGVVQVSGEIDGGTILADGGLVQLFYSRIDGSTLGTANGGTIETFLNAPYFVLGASAVLQDVTIASGSTFWTVGDYVPTDFIGMIANLGTIGISSGGMISGGSNAGATLAGGGVVALAISGDGPGSLQGGGGYSLSNFDNTIEGAGGISGITNEAAGTIDANVTGQALTIGNLTNLGLLEATGRGVLSLSGSVINTGGTINATSGEIDVLGQITGGVLSSNGGGLLASAAAAYGNATLNGVTVAAGSTFIVRGNTDTVINGTLYNAGTTSLTGSGANLSTLSGYGPSYSSLAGGGVVTLSPSGSNARNVVFNLTNVDNTIEGSGRILQITNATAAVVDANLNGQVLDVEDTVTNSGLLTATNGGTLTIGGEVDDAGGAIVADGGVIELVNGVLVGGTLTTANGGTVATLNTSRLNGVTIAAGATFLGMDGSNTYLAGTITNNGTIALAPGATGASFVIASAVTLAGSGVTQLSAIQIASGGSLVIEQAVALDTIDLAGGLLADDSGITIGSNAGAGSASGYGTVTAALIGAGAAPSTITASGGVLDLEGAIDPVALSVAANSTLKLGTSGAATGATLAGATSTLEIASGVTLTTTDSDTLGSGTLLLDGNNASLLAAATGASVSLGATTVANGATIFAGGVVTGAGTILNAGTLSGFGSIDSNVTVIGGAIEAAGGTLDLKGTASNAVLAIGGDPGSQLDLGSAVNDDTVQFEGSAGRLELDDLASAVAGGNGGVQHQDFNAVISGFAIGDTIAFDTNGLGRYSGIDAAAVPVYAASADTTTLALLSEGATVGRLVLSGNYAADVFQMMQDPSSSQLEDLSIACYRRGTMIRTEHGERPIETLGIGDRVITACGAMEPIRWIGRRSYLGRFAARKRDILPVRIHAGALADGVPRRDLWVSPLHAMLLDGILAPARGLLNGATIVQPESTGDVEYFHIELARHDVIWAEGAASETFVDDDSRMMFHNASEYAALYPAAERIPALYCRPRVTEGYRLEAIRQRLAVRAGVSLAVRGEPLRGFLDFVDNGLIEGWAQDPVHPEAPVCLDILVDGVTVAQTLANRYREDLAGAGLGSGRHAFSVRLPDAKMCDSSHAVAVRRASDQAVLAVSDHMRLLYGRGERKVA